jgi:hypothetical protein
LDAIPYSNFFRDDWGYLIVEATHSEFHSGMLGGYIARHNYTNCLMNQTYVGLWKGRGDTHGDRTFRNCTLRGAQFAVARTSADYVLMSVRDCAFEDTAFFDKNDAMVSNATYNDYDYNAYLSTNYFTNQVGANDEYVGEFDWQSGLLGDFYIPTAGGNLDKLINEGSRDADAAGLYHFTTDAVNQTKEAASKVDIGYHYVALNLAGLPVRTDADSLADYLEDANGNGIYDTGDLADWEETHTDTDGLDDGVEVAIGTDPDADNTLEAEGGNAGLLVFTPLH